MPSRYRTAVSLLFIFPIRFAATPSASSRAKEKRRRGKIKAPVAVNDNKIIAETEMYYEFQCFLEYSLFCAYSVCSGSKISSLTARELVSQASSHPSRPRKGTTTKLKQMFLCLLCGLTKVIFLRNVLLSQPMCDLRKNRWIILQYFFCLVFYTSSIEKTPPVSQAYLHVCFTYVCTLQ